MPFPQGISRPQAARGRTMTDQRPPLHPKLKALIDIARDLHPLLSEEKGLTITDVDRQLLYLPGKTGRLDIQTGDLLLPTSVSRRCIQENRPVSQKMRQCLGWDYIGRAVPVKDDSGKILGSVGTVEIIENQPVSERMIIGRSPLCQAVLEQARKVARYDVSVLILGETGTGKEVMAQYLVESSPRKDRPFVTVNCASIPSSLFESEMFGYESGAFTGANSKGRLGYFETANTGTIFLDEVGELDIQLQAKLLRVLDTGKIVRLGGTRERKIDVRIITATNQDLKKNIQSGLFRADFFFRLSSVILTLPPLRSHKEDLPLYIEEFLHREGKKLKKEGIFLEPEALHMLLRYDYPGNIRELQNIITQMIILCDSGIIGKIHLCSQITGNFAETAQTAPESADGAACPGETNGMQPAPDDMNYANMEKKIIQNALLRHPSKSRTARALGISRDTLYRKIRKYGISSG
jgi:transcriptional regulator with PAS, ATPase and Fis domain